MPMAPPRASDLSNAFARAWKTRQALGSEIQATLFLALDEHTWERLDGAPIMSDVGAILTARCRRDAGGEADAGDLEVGRRWGERLTSSFSARSDSPSGDARSTAHSTVNHGGPVSTGPARHDDRQACMATLPRNELSASSSRGRRQPSAPATRPASQLQVWADRSCTSEIRVTGAPFLRTRGASPLLFFVHVARSPIGGSPMSFSSATPPDGPAHPMTT